MPSGLLKGSLPTGTGFARQTAPLRLAGACGTRGFLGVLGATGMLPLGLPAAVRVQRRSEGGDPLR